MGKSNGTRVGISADLTCPAAWIPADAWDGWMQGRSAATVVKRAPITPRVIVLALRNLERLRDEGYSPADVLDEAAQKSWLGIYRPRNAIKGKSKAELDIEREAAERRQQLLDLTPEDRQRARDVRNTALSAFKGRVTPR